MFDTSAQPCSVINSGSCSDNIKDSSKIKTY